MSVVALIPKYLANEDVEYIFGISGATLNNFLVATTAIPGSKPW